MRRICLPVIVIGVLVYVFYLLTDHCLGEATNPANKAGDGGKPAEVSCKKCHTDAVSILPEDHQAVEKWDLATCTSCHEPDMTGTVNSNAFSVRMHLPHVAPKGSLDCIACHEWIAGISFSLIGHKGSWGRPTETDMKLTKEIFSSWAGSNYMDNLHAKAEISCAGCHGSNLAKVDDTVENVRCLICHGPMNQLAKKTEPIDLTERNPHKSHLGEIDCTVCHHAHYESKVYCLNCHKNFNMLIQGKTN